MAIDSMPTSPALETIYARRTAMLDGRPFMIQGVGVLEAAQDRAMAHIDANGDGGLSMDELKTLSPALDGKDGRALFAALDSDGSGKLAMSELCPSSLLSAANLGVLLGAQSGGLGGWMVSEADQDGDGVLSPDEFRRVGPQGDFAPSDGAGGDSTRAIASKSDRAFAQGDTDSDGRLSAAEVGALLSRGIIGTIARTNVSAATDQLMDAADKNGDGLSRDEVEALHTPYADLDKMFSQLDTDHDGRISRAEISAETAREPEFYSQGIGRASLYPGQYHYNDALFRVLRQTVEQVTSRVMDAARPTAETVA